MCDEKDLFSVNISIIQQSNSSVLVWVWIAGIAARSKWWNFWQKMKRILCLFLSFVNEKSFSFVLNNLCVQYNCEMHGWHNINNEHLSTSTKIWLDCGKKKWLTTEYSLYSGCRRTKRTKQFHSNAYFERKTARLTTSKSIDYILLRFISFRFISFCFNSVRVANSSYVVNYSTP